MQRPIVWLQVDIDHFKRINDGHGHAAGDAVLLAVADVLTRLVRADDFVNRTGGGNERQDFCCFAMALGSCSVFRWRFHSL